MLTICRRFVAENEADATVHGATPSEFHAAISATREGESVFLLEPTDHIGGLSTGELSHCDSNQMDRKTVMGLFDEWHMRIVNDDTDRRLKPPYNQALKDQPIWIFKPNVAMRVTKQMHTEARKLGRNDQNIYL